MKLHLPKMLTAALIAAYAVSGAYATTTKTTTYAGGTVFNGDIWTWNNADGQNVSSSNSKYTNYTTSQTYAGNANMTSVGGADAFWKMIQFTSENAYVGNTLRFAGATGNVRLNTDYAKYVWVGGIITEAGNSGTYTLGRDSDTSFYLKGNQPVNMIINSNFTFWATNANNSKVEIGTGGTWTVADGKVLEFNVPSVVHHANQTVNINGTGTVKFTKAYTGQAGAIFNVAEGATLTFAQAAQLGGTITNNGTINFNGTVSLANSLSGFEVSGTYVDYQGHNAANGYAGDLDYTIIKGNTDALTTVTWKGEEQTLNNGVLHVAGEVDYTNYHLITTDYTLDLAAEMGHNAQLSKVTMAAGTTLNYNTNNYSGTIETAATSTVSIAAGVTLSTPLTAGILAGQGTYALASGASSMGAVTRGAGWTGTVKLTGVSSMTNIDLNAYGQQGSKVEMDGITGYFTSVSSVFTPELVLSGSGLVLNDGFSTSAGAPTAYTFAGGVSGAGNMTFSHKNGTKSNVTQNLYFTGDVSQWSGSLSVVAGFTVTAHYSGEALTVGSTISRTDGTLHVDVQAGSNVTFNGAITNASSLTVQEGATATLNAASTIGTLASTGALTVNAGEGTVSFTGASHTIGKTITLAGGTLSLAGAYNLDAMEPTDYDEEYVGPEEGVAAGSGFHKVSGSVQVVTIDNGTLSLAEGATFSYQEASVTVDDKTGKGTFDGVDLTTLWVNGTDPVSYNAAQEYAEQKAPGTIVGTVCLNHDGATITMDRAGASVALVLSEDEEVTSGTVYATEDTTISGITGWAGKELVIDGTSTVTTGALALDNDATVLVVGEDVTLDIAGNNHNLTLQHGSATINGTVTIAHELDLSKGSTSDAELVIGSTGDVKATDGLWLRGGHHFTILDEGRFTVKGLTFVGMGEESTISYNDVATKDGNYSTTEAKYVITNMTILANKDVTINNTLENSTVVTGDHAVTLNTDATNVIVSDGGTFTKGNGATVENITVERTGTVSGVEMADVTIAVDATATFGDETSVSDIDDGVFIYNLQNPIKVQNIGQEAAKYTGLHQEGMKVSADTLHSSADGVTVENTVAVITIQHQGEGVLTLAHVDTEPLEAIEVTNGSLVMQDVTSAVISTMEIAADSSVAAYTDATQTQEATVTITESLNAGGGTLLANLTIVGNELGTTTWVLEGTAMALGSTLTLNTANGLIRLDNATMQQIAALENNGDYLELVLDAGTGLEYIGENWFDGVFSRTYTNAQGVEETLDGDYNVQLLDNGNFGIMKFSDVPEPTTGTLSLLALAALAARRRRK